MIGADQSSGGTHMTHASSPAQGEQILADSDGDLVLAAAHILSETARPEDVTAVVMRWIDTHPEHARLFDTDSNSEAKLIVSLAQALLTDATASEASPSPEALDEARQRIAILTMPQG